MAAAAQVGKDDLLSMVRYGAELVFSSEPTNITESDIEAILTKGERDTAALNDKMQQFTEKVRVCGGLCSLQGCIRLHRAACGCLHLRGWRHMGGGGWQAGLRLPCRLCLLKRAVAPHLLGHGTAGMRQQAFQDGCDALLTQACLPCSGCLLWVDGPWSRMEMQLNAWVLHALMP